MNRALALSLQDQNPDVRKNAIRDLTRIYDLVSQISQLLRHAVDDSDAEVQETARWALSQLSQINTMSNYQPRSALHDWTHPVDNASEL
jgi:vesicle coat complex subunit